MTTLWCLRFPVVDARNQRIMAVGRSRRSEVIPIYFWGSPFAISSRRKNSGENWRTPLPILLPHLPHMFFLLPGAKPFCLYVWTRLQAFHQRSPTLYFQFYALQTLDKQQMVGGPLKYSRVLICAIAHWLTWFLRWGTGLLASNSNDNCWYGCGFLVSESGECVRWWRCATGKLKFTQHTSNYMLRPFCLGHGAKMPNIRCVFIFLSSLTKRWLDDKMRRLPNWQKRSTKNIWIDKKAFASLLNWLYVSKSDSSCWCPISTKLSSTLVCLIFTVFCVNSTLSL